MTATEIENLPHLPSWVDAEAVGALMSANDPWPAQAVAEVAEAQPPLRNHHAWTRACEKYILAHRKELKEVVKLIHNRHGKTAEWWLRRTGS
eukprot:1834218-Prorocentrum_lima.AAC.1